MCPPPRASDAAFYMFPAHGQFILEAAHQREAPRAGSSSRIYLSIEKVGIAKTDARLCENKNQSSSTSEVRSEWSGRTVDGGERWKELADRAKKRRPRPVIVGGIPVRGWLRARGRVCSKEGYCRTEMARFRRNLRFPAITTHSSISRTLYFANLTRTRNTYLVPERHHTTIGANPTIPKRTAQES